MCFHTWRVSSSASIFNVSSPLNTVQYRYLAGILKGGEVSKFQARWHALVCGEEGNLMPNAWYCV